MIARPWKLRLAFLARANLLPKAERWRKGGSYVIDFAVGQSFGEPQDQNERDQAGLLKGLATAVIRISSGSASAPRAGGGIAQWTLTGSLAFGGSIFLVRPGPGHSQPAGSPE